MSETRRPRVIVDADSCPRDVRRYLLTYTQKLEVSLIFVANRKIPVDEAEAGGNFNQVVCSKQSQAADNWILQNAASSDLVVTRDIPLAASLLEKSVTVLNDRGTVFSATNIQRMLKERELNMSMAALGLGTKKRRVYSKKEFASFADCFDREIHQKLKNK